MNPTIFPTNHYKAIELDRKSGEAWEGKGEVFKAFQRDTEAYQAFAKDKEPGYFKNDF
jgi:hypothetical protein